MILGDNSNRYFFIQFLIFGCNIINRVDNRRRKGKSMNYKVGIVIEKDEHGYYAYCPELEGCQTQGDTLDEALANAKEAIELYLESLTEDERASCLSKEILTTAVEVHVG